MYPTGAGVKHMSQNVSMPETGSSKMGRIRQLLHELKNLSNVSLRCEELCGGIIKIHAYVNNVYIDNVDIRYDDLDDSIYELEKLLNKVKQYITLRNMVREVVGNE